MAWYKNGLKFTCTGCGACCAKEPGYVWLSSLEIEQMAKHLNLSQEEFLKRYTRKVFGRVSLLEKPNYDCIFLKNNRCEIYTVRPRQCRTFPWWPDNLDSPQAWKETALRCEGIDHPDAPVVPFETIQENL
jgi:Fe-S-cluster containining protein